MKASDSHESFIDWLKCLGTIVIVYGHIAAWSPPARIAPIYSKQLGVAFFVFVTGYSLARELRPRWQVAFNRLFEVFLFGLPLALLLTCGSLASGGRGQLSNYAPFLLGVNLAMEYFPANPTSWYVGTYIHIILLWALLLSRARVTVAMLAIALTTELTIRALLIHSAHAFIAYMAFPNWLTVLLAGRWAAQHDRPAASRQSWLFWSMALVGGIGVWVAFTSLLSFQLSFPFMLFAAEGSPRFSAALATSALVSAVYSGVTWMTFRATRLIQAPAIVRFVARNSLIIFLAHMPVVYALEGGLRTLLGGRVEAAAALFVVCVFGLAAVSEALHRLIPTRRLRDHAYASLAVRNI